MPFGFEGLVLVWPSLQAEVAESCRRSDLLVQLNERELNQAELPAQLNFAQC